jgi:hypothetical protein
MKSEINGRRKTRSHMPVPPTYNPSDSVGKYQEDCSLKPAQANSLQDPISKKNPSQKKGWWNESTCKP